PERIRDVIGKGGATIRQITETTGTQIDIQDDGSITIAAVDGNAAKRAQQMIEDLTAEVEIGRIYDGTVLKILDFGAIVQVLPGRDGLLHVSQIANERVNQVSDYVAEGQIIRVKVIEADDKGRLRPPTTSPRAPRRSSHRASIEKAAHHGRPFFRSGGASVACLRAVDSTRARQATRVQLSLATRARPSITSLSRCARSERAAT